MAKGDDKKSADAKTPRRKRRKGPTPNEKAAVDRADKAEKSLKRTRRRNRDLRDDMERNAGSRVMNHAAHGAAAVGGTMAAEAIQAADFAKDKLDTPIKSRAIPAALGGLVAIFGGDLVGECLADSVAMGLMAPAEVTLGEMLYDKLTEDKDA